VSSTLKIPTISGISNTGDLTKYGDNLDSLEDLNKEIEKFCPFTSNFIHPHDMKLANSRYCDIFSRQSMESDDNDNSSPDDEERINFLATIPQAGCEILQLVPKKPVVTTDNNKTMYQPCTNTIVQLKQSSCSAFRELSEFRSVAIFDEACGGEDEEASSTSQISSNVDASSNE
jgi:hypothetical protein